MLEPYLPGFSYLGFSKSGFRGVDLFFVLSGFVLMHANGGDFERVSSAALRRFAILRFTRIYPLNTVVLGLILALVLLCPSYWAAYASRYSGLGFFETLTLSNRWLIKESGSWNGPTWSLSYEVMAYAMFPFLTYYIRKEHSALRCISYICALLGISAGYQYATGHATDNPVFRLAIIRAVLTFASGVVLYRLSYLMVIQRANALAWICCFLIALFTAVPRLGLLMPFAFAGVVIISTYQGVRLNKLLSSRISMFFGNVSFSLYLVHYTFIWVLAWLLSTHRVAASSAWPLTVLAVAVSTGLAVALHSYIEVPSQRFGRRWALLRGHALAGFGSAQLDG